MNPFSQIIKVDWHIQDFENISIYNELAFPQTNAGENFLIGLYPKTDLKFLEKSVLFCLYRRVKGKQSCAIKDDFNAVHQISITDKNGEKQNVHGIYNFKT